MEPRAVLVKAARQAEAGQPLVPLVAPVAETAALLVPAGRRAEALSRAAVQEEAALHARVALQEAFSLPAPAAVQGEAALHARAEVQEEFSPPAPAEVQVEAALHARAEVQEEFSPPAPAEVQGEAALHARAEVQEEFSPPAPVAVQVEAALHARAEVQEEFSPPAPAELREELRLLVPAAPMEVGASLGGAMSVGEEAACARPLGVGSSGAAPALAVAVSTPFSVAAVPCRAPPGEARGRGSSALLCMSRSPGSPPSEEEPRPRAVEAGGSAPRSAEESASYRRPSRLAALGFHEVEEEPSTRSHLPTANPPRRAPTRCPVPTPSRRRAR